MFQLALAGPAGYLKDDCSVDVSGVKLPTMPDLCRREKHWHRHREKWPCPPTSAGPVAPTEAAQEEHLLPHRNASAVGLHHATLAHLRVPVYMWSQNVCRSQNVCKLNVTFTHSVFHSQASLREAKLCLHWSQHHLRLLITPHPLMGCGRPAPFECELNLLGSPCGAGWVNKRSGRFNVKLLGQICYLFHSCLSPKRSALMLAEVLQNT